MIKLNNIEDLKTALIFAEKELSNAKRKVETIQWLIKASSKEEV